MCFKLAITAATEHCQPGQRIRFLGRRAKVVDEEEWIWGTIPERWERWAVPVEIEESGTICIAHTDHLSLDY